MNHFLIRSHKQTKQNTQLQGWQISKEAQSDRQSGSGAQGDESKFPLIDILQGTDNDVK